MIPPRFVLALATLTVACAYYNGLYNANRLAGEAQRAESEGRRGDARSLWLQAAVRAESVAARYPDSKYWDDALLMSGRAQRRVGECALALAPLATVVNASDEKPVVDEARVLLAECQLIEQQYDAVIATVTPLMQDNSSRYADRARALRGRAQLARGNAAAAVMDLTPPTNLEGRFDLAAALLANGQRIGARQQLEIAGTYDYDPIRWPPLIDRLGMVDPGGASAFVDQWVSESRLTPDERVQLLVEDADRWSARGDQDIAINRLTEAVGLTENRELDWSIRFRLLVLELRRTANADEIAGHVGAFRDLGTIPVAENTALVAYLNVLDRVTSALSASSSGDLLLFRGAELVRDTLLEDDLAVLLFRRVARDHPTSAIVPKALLAIAQLRPESADSILFVLAREYADSPYTDLATGGVGAGFTALEDSLQRVWNRVSRDSSGRS